MSLCLRKGSCGPTHYSHYGFVLLRRPLLPSAPSFSYFWIVHVYSAQSHLQILLIKDLIACLVIDTDYCNNSHLKYFGETPNNQAVSYQQALGDGGNKKTLSTGRPLYDEGGAAVCRDLLEIELVEKGKGSIGIKNKHRLKKGGDNILLK